MTRFQRETFKFSGVQMEFLSNFPVDCLEVIFSHLQGRDLLKCTLVCPTWNDFIGSTRSCMKKIKLSSFIDGFKVNKRKKMFTDSNRKYENLVLSKEHSRKLWKVLLANEGNWKRVVLANFHRAYHFWDLWEIFQSSVQRLDLRDIDIEEIKRNFVPKEESSDLRFP